MRAPSQPSGSDLVERALAGSHRLHAAAAPLMSGEHAPGRAFAAEGRRAAAIMGLPEARGRELFASRLIDHTGMTVQQAREALRGAPMDVAHLVVSPHPVDLERSLRLARAG